MTETQVSILSDAFIGAIFPKYVTKLLLQFSSTVGAASCFPPKISFGSNATVSHSFGLASLFIVVFLPTL